MEKEHITPLPMTLTVRLGIRHLSIKSITQIKPGDVLALNQTSDQPLDLLLEGKIIGKCEIVSLADKFGMKIVELYDFPLDSL